MYFADDKSRIDTTTRMVVSKCMFLAALKMPDMAQEGNVAFVSGWVVYS